MVGEVVCITVADAPVIVNCVPIVVRALPVAVSVMVLVLKELAGSNEAVTPSGRPLAANSGTPVRPFSGVTVSVEVAVADWLR
jgi:hypothetical protein